MSSNSNFFSDAGKAAYSAAYVDHFTKNLAHQDSPKAGNVDKLTQEEGLKLNAALLEINRRIESGKIKTAHTHTPTNTGIVYLGISDTEQTETLQAIEVFSKIFPPQSTIPAPVTSKRERIKLAINKLVPSRLYENIVTVQKKLIEIDSNVKTKIDEEWIIINDSSENSSRLSEQKSNTTSTLILEESSQNTEDKTGSLEKRNSQQRVSLENPFGKDKEKTKNSNEKEEKTSAETSRQIIRPEKKSPKELELTNEELKQLSQEVFLKSAVKLTSNTTTTTTTTTQNKEDAAQQPQKVPKKQPKKKIQDNPAPFVLPTTITKEMLEEQHQKKLEQEKPFWDGWF